MGGGASANDCQKCGAGTWSDVLGANVVGLDCKRSDGVSNLRCRWVTKIQNVLSSDRQGFFFDLWMFDSWGVLML